MKYLLVTAVFFLTFSISQGDICDAFTSAENAPHEKSDSKGGGDLLKERIDFGDSYITGQSIKSGAVYLLQRKPSEIKSMLSYRESYRDEILESFSVKESKPRKGAGAFLKVGMNGR